MTRVAQNRQATCQIHKIGRQTNKLVKSATALLIARIPQFFYQMIMNLAIIATSFA